MFLLFNIPDNSQKCYCWEWWELKSMHVEMEQVWGGHYRRILLWYVLKLHSLQWLWILLLQCIWKITGWGSQVQEGTWEGKEKGKKPIYPGQKIGTGTAHYPSIHYLLVIHIDLIWLIPGACHGCSVILKFLITPSATFWLSNLYNPNNQLDNSGLSSLFLFLSF